MKISRRDTKCKAHAIPVLRFEDQSLTSFSGLVVFQQFFARIGLKARLSRCFRHLAGGKVFGLPTIFLQLVMHLLIGFRELRDGQYYQDDPLVKRFLGLNRRPDVATVSRTLKDADEKSVKALRGMLRDMVVERICESLLTRVTLDFDGSVQSTGKYVIPNQLYLLAGLFAHNLTRELQMATTDPSRGMTTKRAALWVFSTLNTLRRNVIQRAGRLTRPNGVLTLTVGANRKVKEQVQRLTTILQSAA